MDEIFKSAVSQAPGLVVLVIIVIVFIKYLMTVHGLIKALTDEHIYERRMMREVLEKNVHAMEKNENSTNTNTVALNNLAHVVVESCKFKPNK